MDTSLNIKPATPEIVWAMLRELAEKHADLAERHADFAERQAGLADRLAELTEKQTETDRLMKETDRQMKETDRQMKETDRKLDKVGVQLGGIANNQGRFAEEYFINSFEKGKRNFFGEKFDDIKNNLKGTETNDEFDIVMLNGQSVGIVEIKYKAHEKDVQEVLGKVNTFRSNFPKYKNHTIYLGLASMAFYPELEQICKDNGIAIIKQAGDLIVINDEHLKAF